MKYKILLSALLCCSLFSCKKDKDNPVPSAESKCYAKSVAFSQDDQTYHIFHTQIRSQDGKTSEFTLSEGSNLSNSQIKHIKSDISDKNIIRSYFDKNRNPVDLNDTIWINERKLPIKAIEHFNFDNGSLMIDQTDYYYENNLLIKTIKRRTFNSEPSEIVKLFTYVDGICSQTIEIVNRTGIDIHDTTYVNYEYYLDKPAQEELAYKYANPGKHLIKRAEEINIIQGQFRIKDVENYTYETNADGLVTKQITTNAAGKAVRYAKYEYSCQ
ncbi:MAG: hypothetical protein NVV82_05940 [Sporocytophaga sp.]|nr:hypothetical protein [Sporocytophaga sp.]